MTENPLATAEHVCDNDHPPCPRCGNTCSRDRTFIGALRIGALYQCLSGPEGSPCGEEWVIPDADVAAVAAARVEQVAAEHGEAVIERTVGPLPDGSITRLRHPDMVEVLAKAAEHGRGTAESVVVWLRANGYEIVGAPPVQCTCLHGAPGDVVRNPLCGVHGDADALS